MRKCNTFLKMYFAPGLGSLEYSSHGASGNALTFTINHSLLIFFHDLISPNVQVISDHDHPSFFFNNILPLKMAVGRICIEK